MIRINLLPHREERRKTLRQQFFVLAGLVAVLAGVVWFVGFTYIENQIETQAEKNAFLKSEISVLDKQIEEIKALKEQTDIMLARKRVIESLQANRSETVHLFNELATQIPPGVFLRSIKQENQKITLVGYAQSSARVSTLMQNLDASPVLERPLLVEIKAAQVGKQRMNEFTLAIHITRQTNDAPPKKPAVGAGKPGAKP
ncbi:MAG: PilN domain-containing protein [Rhodocyclaceae bacterium]|nr:PilN domain-containing protein [Rhodocyclaceae bacterium]MDZ4215849.1 PilN domain-containing protein [Rhodocyclaceae bacterium]